MRPLRILILTDGRPGHANLSEGIAGAVGRLREVEVERFDVRRGKWPGALLATMATARLPAGSMLSKVYGIDPKGVPEADLILSAGAETLAASIWLSRLRKVPNIHYGSIRLFDPQDFALILTSYRRNARRPRHALALKPSRLNPDELARSNTGGTWPPQTAALVIGGDTRGISFTAGDWTKLLDFLSSMHRDHGTRWRIANSRRTPSEVSDRLKQAASRTDGAILQFLDIREAGAGTLTGLLASSDAVLCTADSSSMVSECIWMQLPTVAIEPAAFKLNANEAAYRNWLENRGWVRSVAIRSLSPEALKTALAQIRPSRTNRQQELAGLIADALPDLFPGGGDRVEPEQR